MKSRTSWSFALLALALLGSSVGIAEAQRWYGRSVVPAGTTLDVRVENQISSSEAHPGDTWTGTVIRSVVSDGRAAIPAGTRVTGVVVDAQQGTHESRPRLDLAVREVSIDGRSYRVDATTEPIIGGSKRAKKIGAIVGGAAVGGLLGHAIGGGKGTLIGGVAGGAAGYGLSRHALRTLHVKEGTVLQFTMRDEMVASRRWSRSRY